MNSSYLNSSKYSLKYYSKNKIEDFKLKYDNNQNKIFSCFFIFLIIFLIFRLIITCFGLCLLNSKENEIKKEEIDSCDSSNDESISLDSLEKKTILFSKKKITIDKI